MPGPGSSPSLGGHDDDLLEVQGARACEPLLVPRGWLRDHLPAPGSHPRGPRRAQQPFVPCDPLTGARLDPGDHLATHAYRPGQELAALVRARDGRCRFPGCSVAARFCDLDHVRPWPIGRTSASNLLTVCRRHHRIKQRPGWHVHLAPDGTATWTDPTGRTRTTEPLDALTPVVLAGEPDPPTLCPRPSTYPAHSTLEVLLEVQADHLTALLEQQDSAHALPSTHRRCTSAAQLRAALALRRLRAPLPDVPPF